MIVDRKKIIGNQIDFAATDTICFGAPYPEELQNLQKREWMPVIKRMNDSGCDFQISNGLEVPELSEKTRLFLEKRLNALSDEALCAFAAVSGGCRSVILALAVLDGFLSADRAFELAVLEESFQNRFWPCDEEALTARENRKKDVVKAAENLKGILNG